MSISSIMEIKKQKKNYMCFWMLWRIPMVLKLVSSSIEKISKSDFFIKVRFQISIVPFIGIKTPPFIFNKKIGIGISFFFIKHLCETKFLRELINIILHYWNIKYQTIKEKNRNMLYL